MRFNNRACALMEIPDLPQGAFEHLKAVVEVALFLQSQTLFLMY